MDLSLHSGYIGACQCVCVLLAYDRSDKLFTQEFHVNAYS